MNSVVIFYIIVVNVTQWLYYDFFVDSMGLIAISLAQVSMSYLT